MKYDDTLKTNNIHKSQSHTSVKYLVHRPVLYCFNLLPFISQTATFVLKNKNKKNNGKEILYFFLLCILFLLHACIQNVAVSPM